jgi:hypothetical protein
MRQSSQLRYTTVDPQSPQPGGLIGRIVALVIGCAAFVAAVVVGAIFLAGLVGLILIGWLVFMLRVWWLQRQFDRNAGPSSDLEGQYTVIQEETHTIIREDDRHP